MLLRCLFPLWWIPNLFPLSTAGSLDYTSIQSITCQQAITAVWTSSPPLHQQSQLPVGDTDDRQKVPCREDTTSHGTGQLRVNHQKLGCVTPWTCDTMTEQNQLMGHTEFVPLHLIYLHHVEHRRSFTSCLHLVWEKHGTLFPSSLLHSWGGLASQYCWCSLVLFENTQVANESTALLGSNPKQYQASCSLPRGECQSN